jgi:hypothetical protein
LSGEFVDEACFYLSENKVARKEIARSLNLTASKVGQAITTFKRKIETGEAVFDQEAKEFWAKNYRESSGDERITLVDDKGRYYHGWKTELRALSSEKLAELLGINKQYSDKHPLSEFSKGGAVIGYDPIVPLRNIRRTVSILEEALQSKENEENKTITKAKKRSNILDEA